MYWVLWFSCVASAQSVTWDGVVDAAIDAWGSAEGASVQAHVDGVQRAERVAGSPLTVSTGSRLGSPSNQEVAATLLAPISTSRRARQSYRAHADEVRSEGTADRHHFVQQVLQAWTSWWTSRELVEHLEHWSTDVEATLQPLDRAVSEGVSAPLDAEDLRAELATVRAEAAAARADAVRAEATLRTLLGPDAVLDGGEAHLHDLTVTDIPNPWHDLLDDAGDAPDVRLALARADALHAEARDLAAWRPTAELGVAFADGNGDFEPLVVVGLQSPLRSPDLAAAREARAQATAQQRRAEWRTERVRGAWRAEAVGFDADRERIDRLDSEVVQPLAVRLERLQQAYAEGLVPADRVVRARRDHHEAEHERLVLAAHLLASSARAQATLRMLELP